MLITDDCSKVSVETVQQQAYQLLKSKTFLCTTVRREAPPRQSRMHGRRAPGPYSGFSRVGGRWHFSLQDGALTQQILLHSRFPCVFPNISHGQRCSRGNCPNSTSLTCLLTMSWGWNPYSPQESICFNFSVFRILPKEQRVKD